MSDLQCDAVRRTACRQPAHNPLQRPLLTPRSGLPTRPGPEQGLGFFLCPACDACRRCESPAGRSSIVTPPAVPPVAPRRCQVKKSGKIPNEEWHRLGHGGRRSSPEAEKGWDKPKKAGTPSCMGDPPLGGTRSFAPHYMPAHCSDGDGEARRSEPRAPASGQSPDCEGGPGRTSKSRNAEMKDVSGASVCRRGGSSAIAGCHVRCLRSSRPEPATPPNPAGRSPAATRRLPRTLHDKSRTTRPNGEPTARDSRRLDQVRV